MTVFAAVDLQGIRTALRDQLFTQFDGAVNVYANNEEPTRKPCITILPSADRYVSYFETFGPNGMTDVALTLLIEAGARTVDTQIKLDGFLSIGSATSIVDALEADKTLGGVVQTCIALSASVVATEDGYVATVPLQIVVKKGGN